ncbi:hypothetical protein OIU84_002870 [Salix udensis]|uniref:Uncharacterized protein n=1 Tax=Salix udensis TaxID=889485 RepID=A0AAD6K6J2_9ROSI|nr:hypothetical protein OIU84_002870 [Salix udensis]
MGPEILETRRRIPSVLGIGRRGAEASMVRERSRGRIERIIRLTTFKLREPRPM